MWRAATFRLGLLLWLSTELIAQGLSIELASDSERPGPSAWSRVRSDLPKLIESWPADLSPHSALQLNISTEGQLSVRRSEEPLDSEAYLKAQITLEGIHGQGHCSFDGLERWQVTLESTPPTRLSDLAWLLHIKPDTGLRSFDWGPLVAHLSPPLDESYALARGLNLTAAACGQVEFTVYEEGTRIAVSGTSGGGLLLPALLALQADLRKHPSPVQGQMPSRTPTAIEKWSLMASSGLGTVREEGARQLARYSGSTAESTLGGLLFAEAPLDVIAMNSMMHRADPSILPELAQAVDSGETHSEQLASIGLHALWGRTPTPTRELTRRVLARGKHSDLLQLTDQLNQTAPQPIETEDPTPWVSAWRLTILSLLTGSAALAFIALRRSH